MAAIFDPTLPGDLKHEFKITQSLSVTPEVTEGFRPVEMPSTEELKPSEAVVKLTLKF